MKLRGCGLIRKITGIMLACTMMVGMLPAIPVSAVDDYVTELCVDYNKGRIKFDTEYGPLYELDLNTGEIMATTCDDAKVVSYSKNGNIVNVTVYSSELPENQSYVLDLSKAETYESSELVKGDESEDNDNNVITDDTISEAYIYVYSNILYFDTEYGPAYTVNLNSKEIIECSCDAAFPEDQKAEIRKMNIVGNIVTITVYSAELPREMTYTIDISTIEQNINIVDDPNWSLVCPSEDRYVLYYESRNEIVFNTEKGPIYVINVDDGKLIYSSADEAKVTDYSCNGNIITIKVYSSELPYEVTYTIDIEKLTISGEEDREENTDDEEWYWAYLTEDGSVSYVEKKNAIVFDTAKGPVYVLNADNGELIYSSADVAKVLEYSRNGNIITVKLYSDELPYELLYTIDLKNLTISGEEALYDLDEIQYYVVYTNDTIEFDSTMGPWYSIDYVNKTILGCSYEEARIINCEKNGEILTLTVYSDELPVEKTYTFDLSKNRQEASKYGAGSGGFDGLDNVEYFNILKYNNSLEFDSKYGPYYKIDLINGTILECTSDNLYPDQPKAEVKYYSYYGDNITITVYSAELPYDMTYTFNTTTNEQVCGVGSYDKEATEKEFTNIIDNIIKGDYKGGVVDKETAEKIQKAYKEGKQIITTVEASSMSLDRVDKETREKVEKELKGKGLECVQYLDISVTVYADGELLGKINELENAISFSLEASDETIRADRDYYVVRYHNGEVDVLKTQYNDDGSMNFETDRFSTYVLVSIEKGAKVATVDDNNSDGGFNILWVIIPVVIVACIAGVVAFIILKKKKNLENVNVDDSDNSGNDVSEDNNTEE